jgi:hypothetical protein
MPQLQAGYGRQAVRELTERVVAELRNAPIARDSKKVTGPCGSISASDRAPPQDFFDSAATGFARTGEKELPDAGPEPGIPRSYRPCGPTGNPIGTTSGEPP